MDIKKLAQQYMAGWQKSFTEKNPYSSVTADSEDLMHIEAGIQTMLASPELLWNLLEETNLGHPAGLKIVLSNQDGSVQFGKLDWLTDKNYVGMLKSQGFTHWLPLASPTEKSNPV